MRDLVSTGAQRAGMMVGMDTAAPKSHPPGEYERCPRCSGAENHAFYTDPCQYECQSCGATWDGTNGLKVLTGEEARAKRPDMYHLCGWCGHHVRNGATQAQESAGRWSRGSCGAKVEPGQRLVAGLLVDECYAFDDRRRDAVPFIQDPASPHPMRVSLTPSAATKETP